MSKVIHDNDQGRIRRFSYPGSKLTMNILALYRIPMTEHERGYGQRPDGFVYVLSLEAAQAFIKEYNKDLQKNTTPDTYTLCGLPKLFAFKTQSDYEASELPSTYRGRSFLVNTANAASLPRL